MQQGITNTMPLLRTDLVGIFFLNIKVEVCRVIYILNVY